MPKPIIDSEKCTVCGACVEACPVDVLEKKEDKIEVINEDACISCRACEGACPTQAIKVED